jgi:hypothetical protein
MFGPETDPSLRNAIPRGHVPRAVFIDRMVLTRAIHVFDVRKLVRSLGDASLVFIFFILGTVGDACHT